MILPSEWETLCGFTQSEITALLQHDFNQNNSHVRVFSPQEGGDFQ